MRRCFAELLLTTNRMISFHFLFSPSLVEHPTYASFGLNTYNYIRFSSSVFILPCFCFRLLMTSPLLSEDENVEFYGVILFPFSFSLSFSLSLSLSLPPSLTVSHSHLLRMFICRSGSNRKYVRTVASSATTNTDKRVFDAMNVYRRECVGVTGR